MTNQLSQRTVSFLLKDDKILLGFKKTGFGKGNYLGIGGKIEQGESEIAAAAREIKEEISVSQPQLQKVGNFTFLFPEKPEWSQQVHAFLCPKWEGEPQESNEVQPKWFDCGEIPFSHMWDDNQFWLPAILNGHKLKGTFIFSASLKVVKVELLEHREKLLNLLSRITTT